MNNESSPNLSISVRRPHNYFNELSPAQQEEHRRLEVMIAEAEKYRKIGEAVNMFESFQRWLKTAEHSKSAKSKPRTEQKPLLEEVLIARGLLHVKKPSMEAKSN